MIPVGLGYSHAPPSLFTEAAICFGAPLTVPDDSGREAVQRFNGLLAKGMHAAEQAAREAVGRPLDCF